MDLSLILINTSCEISLIPKESKRISLLLSVNYETQCVSLLCLSWIFIKHSPRFILGKFLYKKRN